MNKPKVIQAEHLSPEAVSWLEERCELIVCAHDDPKFAAHLAQADGVIVRTYTQVNAELLQRAPKLRVVGRAGVGLDNIDLAACRDRGVQVVFTPDANTQAVVEYVLCLLCDALRPRVALQHAVESRPWNQLRAEIVGTRQMNELTLGVLGLGRVGKRIAEVAGAIGFTVLYNDLVEIPRTDRRGAAPVSVEALFQRSDVISIHIDGREFNRMFVGERLIKGLKPEVVLINTSRGFVVDNLSLASFMREHPQAQAFLDVHEPEPFGPDYPLLGLPNVRLYPHLASRTETAMSNMSWVARDVMAVLEGRQPAFPAW